MNPDKIKYLEDDGWKVGSADEFVRGQGCPSCDGEATTTWVDHKFQYGTDEDHVMLKCKVPLHTCLHCGEKWLDHISEDIMAEVVRVHLLPPVVIDDKWTVEAAEAAQRADAYSIGSVLTLMESYKVQVDEMDEWCAQAREDYPCLFMCHVVEGLS
jgi:hypothetical protein